MTEAEPERTHFKHHEWWEIEEQLTAMSAGTKRLAPVLKGRNPRLTALQRSTMLTNVERTIRNLEEFKKSILDLTD